QECRFFPALCTTLRAVLNFYNNNGRAEQILNVRAQSDFPRTKKAKKPKLPKTAHKGTIPIRVFFRKSGQEAENRHNAVSAQKGYNSAALQYWEDPTAVNCGPSRSRPGWPTG